MKCKREAGEALTENPWMQEWLFGNNSLITKLSAFYCVLLCVADLYSPGRKHNILPYSMFCDTNWKYKLQILFPLPSLAILFIFSVFLRLFLVFLRRSLILS
jgi:hypothetical protein